MTPSTTLPLVSSPRLSGFWPFANAGELYLAVFERSENVKPATLSLGRIVGAKLEGFRVVAPLPRAVAVCAAQSRGDALLALEMNRARPGAMASIALRDLVSGASGLSERGTMALSDAQVARVQLVPSELWNVAGPLDPRKWLFSPCPVADGSGMAVVANTADGLAVIAGSNEVELSSLAIPDAAQPQAWVHAGKLRLAFLRYSQPYRPFWSLSRYSGSGQLGSGTLWTSSPGESSEDLSSALGIGKVTAFATAPGPDRQPWLFAAHRSEQETRIEGIVRRDGAWHVEGRWSLDCPADRIAVSYSHDGWSCIAMVEAEDGVASLRYAALR